MELYQFLGGDRVLHNGFIFHRQLAQNCQIGKSCIVLAVVNAVRIYEIGTGHTHCLGLGIHLHHKRLHSCACAQIGIFFDDPTGLAGKHIGRIVSAGQQHGFHQLSGGEHIALLDFSNRRAPGYQIQHITGGNFCFRVYILHRHIGGEQLGNAGGINSLGFRSGRDQKCICFAVIHKILLCKELPVSGIGIPGGSRLGSLRGRRNRGFGGGAAGGLQIVRGEGRLCQGGADDDCNHNQYCQYSQLQIHQFLHNVPLFVKLCSIIHPPHEKR